MRILRALLVAVVACASLLVQAVPASAEAGPGDVLLATTYPSLVTEKSNSLSLPVDVVNLTQQYQEVALAIVEGPTDWKPALKDSGLEIRRAMVGPGRTQSLTLQAKVPAAAKAGDYAYLVRATSPGGRVVSELRFTITVRDVVGGGLELTTQFPNIRGQAGTTFSFRFDLVNVASQERDISVTAALPKDWDAQIKPAFETKQVPSFRVKGGATQGVDVDITAPQKAEAAVYDIVVSAAAGSDRVDTPLKILIVGTSRISLSTPSGQLSAKATTDQDSVVDLRVKNDGTGPVQGVSLSALTAAGWTTKFEPAKLDVIGPGETASVKLTLRPSSRALAGDYLISVTASGQAANDSKDIRITVETPTGWGILALLAILAVFGGLGWVFMRLSRR